MTCVSNDKLLKRTSVDLRRAEDGEETHQEDLRSLKFVCNGSPRIVESVGWSKVTLSAGTLIILTASLIFISFYAGSLYNARQSKECITVHVEQEDVAGNDLSERRFLAQARVAQPREGQNSAGAPTWNEEWEEEYQEEEYQSNGVTNKWAHKEGALPPGSKICFRDDYDFLTMVRHCDSKMCAFLRPKPSRTCQVVFNSKMEEKQLG